MVFGIRITYPINLSLEARRKLGYRPHMKAKVRKDKYPALLFPFVNFVIHGNENFPINSSHFRWGMTYFSHLRYNSAQHWSSLPEGWHTV